MTLLTQLIIRSILVIALNDGIILYVVKKRSMPITAPLVISMILVTSLAMIINIWFSLNRAGLI